MHPARSTKVRSAALRGPAVATADKAPSAWAWSRTGTPSSPGPELHGVWTWFPPMCSPGHRPALEVCVLCRRKCRYQRSGKSDAPCGKLGPIAGGGPSSFAVSQDTSLYSTTLQRAEFHFTHCLSMALMPTHRHTPSLSTHSRFRSGRIGCDGLCTPARGADASGRAVRSLKKESWSRRSGRWGRKDKLLIHLIRSAFLPSRPMAAPGCAKGMNRKKRTTNDPAAEGQAVTTVNEALFRVTGPLSRDIKTMTGVDEALTPVTGALTTVIKALTPVIIPLTRVTEPLTCVIKALSCITEPLTRVIKAMSCVTGPLSRVIKALTPVSGPLTTVDHGHHGAVREPQFAPAARAGERYAGRGPPRSRARTRGPPGTAW